MPTKFMLRFCFRAFELLRGRLLHVEVFGISLTFGNLHVQVWCGCRGRPGCKRFRASGSSDVPEWLRGVDLYRPLDEVLWSSMFLVKCAHNVVAFAISCLSLRLPPGYRNPSEKPLGNPIQDFFRTWYHISKSSRNLRPRQGRGGVLLAGVPPGWFVTAGWPVRPAENLARASGDAGEGASAAIVRFRVGDRYCYFCCCSGGSCFSF